MSFKWVDKYGARRFRKVSNRDLDEHLTVVHELLKAQNAILQRIDIKMQPTVLRAVPPIGSNLDDVH